MNEYVQYRRAIKGEKVQLVLLGIYLETTDQSNSVMTYAFQQDRQEIARVNRGESSFK